MRALSNPVRIESPERGVDGRTTLAGARAPLMTDGRIGDFWIDKVAKKLYGPKTAAAWPDNGLIRGPNGWTALTRVVADGTRRVREIYEWIGGEGEKPAIGYEGLDGIVPLITDAEDYRGPEGPQTLINALAPAAVDIADETLIATGEENEDNKQRTAVEAFDLGGDLPRRTVAHATASRIRKQIGTVTTRGFASRGDGGGAIYQRVNSEPLSGGKFRSLDRWTADGNQDSANGGWWELQRSARSDVSITQLGAKPGLANVEATTTALKFAIANYSRVIIPEGEWYFNKTLNVKRAAAICGVSGTDAASDYPSKLICARDDIPAIIFHTRRTAGDDVGNLTYNANGQGGSDGWSMEHLRIQRGNGAAIAIDDKSHGVWVKSRGVIRDCEIAGFAGNGFHMVATATVTDPLLHGNANNTKSYGLRVTNSGNGFFSSGADANAGNFHGLNVSLNARIGAWDDTALGNNFWGPHSASNGQVVSQCAFNGTRWHLAMTATEEQAVATQPGMNEAIWRDTGVTSVSGFTPWTPGLPVGTFKRGGAYYSSFISARTGFFGAYAEGGQGFCYAGIRSVILGGIQESPFVTGGVLVGSLDGLNSLTQSIGTSQANAVIAGNKASGEFFRFTGKDVDGSNDIGTWRLRRLGDNLLFDNNNQASRQAFLITGPTTAIQMGTGAPVPYTFCVPMLALGPLTGTGSRRLTYASAAPTSGVWARGDRIYNTNPTPGGKEGWVCTTGGIGGSTAVFKTFGSIDA